MKYRNSLQKGSVRFIIFREGDSWYGTCLEFNIVESGDTPQEAMLLLFEAVDGYLSSARKVKARPHILNQKPDTQYEQLWSRLRAAKTRKEYPKPVFSFGELNLGARRSALVMA